MEKRGGTSRLVQSYHAVGSQHFLAAAAELFLVNLQARADLELVRNIVLAKAACICAAGAILDRVLLRILVLRESRARHDNDGEKKRYTANHDEFLPGTISTTHRVIGAKVRLVQKSPAEPRWSILPP